MGYIKDLEKKIKDYTESDYEIVETKTIPSAEDVAFGKKAYKIKLTTFCIDLRKSTDLLRIHDKETCGKIHKSFLTIATTIIAQNGGQLRSFNGDSVLAFWPAQYKSQIEDSVRAAFQLKWALDVKFSKYFEQYSKLDFGIGIDFGDVYIVKAGLPKNDNTNDLVFLGMCVNFATMIANQAKGPSHIEISTDIHSNLNDDWLYGVSNGVKKSMWTDGKVNWKGKEWHTKCTSWYNSVED
jgi:class 3 adenylate cyclase